MTTGWQTVESLDEGIRLRDEAEHVLFFLTDVLYRMVPPLLRELGESLAAAFPERGGDVRVPIVVQFGTWVGGDMDGNPHVTAKSIRQTLARQRSLVLNLYYRECARARGAPEPERVGGVRTSRRHGAYAEHCPEAAARCRRALGHDRCRIAYFLGLVAARLKATYDDRVFPYESPASWSRISSWWRQPAREQGPQRRAVRVRRLLRRVRTFGFHWRRRHSAERARAPRVIGEALQTSWLGSRTTDERTRRLEEALERRESPLGDCRRGAAARSPCSRRSRTAGASTAASRSAPTS